MTTVDTTVRFATAWRGEEPVAGRLRSCDEDFHVEELFEPQRDEAGGNLCVLLRKRGQNTHWVAGELARRLGAPEAEIGFAGRKDRRAVTSQWFSIPRHRLPPGNVEAVRELLPPDVEMLASVPVRSRLRPGDHQGNRFVIVVREVSLDRDTANRRLQQIAQNGIPNYFGEQRFGRDRANVVRGAALLMARRLTHHPQRSMLLSAVRSWVFNLVLSSRVQDGSWLDSDIPDGPLWGRGRSAAGVDVNDYEARVTESVAAVRDQLEFAGLTSARRSLVLVPSNFNFEWLGDDALQLGFTLPGGAFATSVLRELGNFVESPLC